MTSTAYSFAEHLRQEIMAPKRLLYDTAFGVLGTAALDAIGGDIFIGNVADMLDLSQQRTNQLAAGLTFSALNALERSTLRTLA